MYAILGLPMETKNEPGPEAGTLPGATRKANDAILRLRTTLSRFLPARLVDVVLGVYVRVRRLPIYEFYAYMWATNRPLLASTVFVNYLLPLILEGLFFFLSLSLTVCYSAMPWYLSRRKISKKLRDDRNTIQYRLIKGEPFAAGTMGGFVLFSFVYALLQTGEQILRNRVELANKLVVKRSDTVPCVCLPCHYLP